MGREYRIVWKRVGLDAKRKRVVHRKTAEKFAALLGDREPWKRLGQDPEKLACCDGYECGCGGLTVRESFAQQFGDMPDLEFVRIESREIGEWEPHPSATP